MVKEHPRRAEISDGDKTQLMQLERWGEVGTPTDVAIKTAFKTHEAKLAGEVSCSLGHLPNQSLPHLPS